MPTTTDGARLAGRLRQRLAARLADPDADHPIIKAIFDKVLPIALNWLLTQLPIWLASIDDDPDTNPQATTPDTNTNDA